MTGIKPNFAHMIFLKPTWRLLCTLLLCASELLSAQQEHLEVPTGSRGQSGTLHLYFFNDQKVQLELIDLSAQKTSLMTLRKTNSDFLAAINAQQQEASGLIFKNQTVIKPFTPPQMGNEGLYYQDLKGIHLTQRKGFQLQNKPSLNLAVQTGPFLLYNGNLSANLDSSRFARRTLLLHDGKNTWALAYCPPTSLAKLGSILKETTLTRGFKTHSALQLSEGNSSYFWVSHGKRHPFLLSPLSPTRYCLGIKKK